jgi:mRNA interferase RelE/StbE
MASYNIVFKPSVGKDLRSLPKPMVARVLKQIESLRENPFPPQHVKLAGAERLYRIWVGDYRVVYGVDTESRQITIHYVRHRREVYRGL